MKIIMPIALLAHRQRHPRTARSDQRDHRQREDHRQQHGEADRVSVSAAHRLRRGPSLMRLRLNPSRRSCNGTSAASAAMSPRCTILPLSITSTVSPICLGDMEILFDQQDGGAAAFYFGRSIRSRPRCRSARPLVGSSISSSLRGSTTARAIDQHLFLSAGQRARARQPEPF